MKTNISTPGGAESGALRPAVANLTPDLVDLIDAWPRLPDALKAGILAMVRGAGG